MFFPRGVKRSYYKALCLNFERCKNYLFKWGYFTNCGICEKVGEQ